MHSILIVDDEDPVLESYTYMIKSSELDLRICGTARSGAEALSIARSCHPDIIIIDIVMPGIDGLETIAEMQRTLPESLYIVASAYERFDLAHRAIPLLVFAYLLKPVSRNRFLETLREAKSCLSAHEAEQSRRLESAHTAAAVRRREEQDFLLRMTWKSLTDSEWRRYSQLFNLTTEYGRVVFVQISGLPDAEQLTTAYERIVERLERRHHCLSTRYMTCLLLFIPDRTDAGRLGSYLDTVIAECIREDRQAQARVGIGEQRHYITLYLSSEEAMQTVTQPTPSLQYDMHTDLFGRKIREVVAGPRPVEEVQDLCAQIWDQIFSEQPFPVARARMTVYFAFLLSDLARRSGPESSQLVISLTGDPAVAITAIETREEWEAWAGRAIRLITERRSASPGAPLPAALARAVDFIAAQYARPLQLGTVAEHSRVSSGYLSRLFSEHLHTTFNDYLTGVRIEAAKEHLAEGSLSIKEIAHATGFSDPNYFSRIFKKRTGVSPTHRYPRTLEPSDAQR